MTPDKKPFFAGTYFPKESRFGQTGMLKLVPIISDLWTKRRSEVIKTGAQVVAALQRASKDSAERN
jgi:hypothetical protein